jgi:biotin-dependent carboxylase-like uncharacterized protein
VTRAAFVVDHAGPLTSFQDQGRPGYMRYGIPASGPMDRTAFAIANAALGNEAGAAAIETTIGGLALLCVEGAVTVATAGGGFRLSVDGREAGSWTALTVRAGSRLEIRPGHWGSWTYLAFAGRLVVPAWLGSSATHTISGLGGGRLSKGRRIEIAEAEIRPERTGDIPSAVPARPRPEVRVVLGPQDRFFAPVTIERLLTQPFALTTEYDRMGVRLKGPPLPIAASLDMPSEALVRGSVQVPGHGDPIVLLADHQTTGGYPKIATVASVDQDMFAQLRSRQTVTFRSISAEQAVAAARTRALANRGYLKALQSRALEHLT